MVVLNRQSDNGEPEVIYRAHHIGELFEIYRLADITIGVQTIGFDDIFLGL
jgi:hypothetical protein